MATESDSGLKEFVYDQVEIGEELGSYDYVLTQEILDNFRASIDDPGCVVSHPGGEARRHCAGDGLRRHHRRGQRRQ